MDSMSSALYGLRPASRTTRYQAWDPKTELLHGDYADAVVAVVRSRTAVLRHWPNVGGWQHGFRWDHMVEDYRVPLLCFDQAREVTGKSGLYGRGVKVAARQDSVCHTLRLGRGCTRIFRIRFSDPALRRLWEH